MTTPSVFKISESVKTFRLTHEKSPVLQLSDNSEIIDKTFELSKSEGGSRFNDGARGAWYCALDSDTAIAEVAYHQVRRMDKIGMYEPGVYRGKVIFQELLAWFVDPFHDIRGLPGGKDFLGTEPKIAYPTGRDYANKLRAKGELGIIYESVRRPGGICLAAFYPQMVRDLQFGKRWKISWNESHEHTAEEI